MRVYEEEDIASIGVAPNPSVRWAEDEILFLSRAGAAGGDWDTGRFIGELIVKLARIVACGKAWA